MTKKNNATVRRLTAACLAVIFALLGTTAFGASIDRDTALAFATNWLAATDNPLGADISSRSFADITPLANPDGSTIAWVLSMNPKGFLVLAADDRVNPVVFVSADGTFKDDKKNILAGVLRANLTNRMAAVEELAPQTRGEGELPAGIKENKALWDTYKAQTRALPVNVITDVYVGSFVETRWSQTDGIFNYYTPTIYGTYYTFDEPGNEDNICSGCVATGTAQILRYFKWPQAPVGKVQGSCTIVMRDPATANPPTVLITPYLRGGDGKGGAYNWEAMTVYPQGGCTIETQQAIGALLFDAGLSVGMTYNMDNGNESGANYTASTMKSLFKYSGARGLTFGSEVRASLDARRAVAISIADPFGESGHAIVCDGYGQMGGRWYYHMNFGWGGGSDGWYNFDENIIPTTVGTGGTSLYLANASASIGNIYRQAMQPNEDAVNGQILSGRILDANGTPVAGVAVKIRRTDGSSYEQHMLAWYDPINPDINVDDATYTDDPTTNYRNTTDARGIWAVDKVAAGTYEIVLEKEGVTFAGTKTVTVTNKNLWGLNYIATPWEEELAIKNWWLDGNLVYIEFNSQFGDVNVDLSKIKIGSKVLTGGTAYFDAASQYMVIDVTGLGVTSGSLVTSAGFLTITTQTEKTGDGTTTTVAVPSTNVDILPAATVSAGSATAPSVTSIVRTDGAEQNTADRFISFTVSGSDLSSITAADLRVKVISSGKIATVAPYATISSWDSSTGVALVQVGDGDGYVRLDYVPAEGTPFLSGESYYVDNLAPAILSAKLSADNLYVDITWNEAVGRDAAPDIHNIADEGFAFAYTGTPGTSSYKLWSKAALNTADTKFTTGIDTIISDKTGLQDGDMGTATCTGNNVFLRVSYFIDLTIGRFVFADENENGKYDKGECVYMQLINNMNELGLSFSPKFDTYLGESDNSVAYAKRFVIAGKLPAEGTAVYPLSEAGVPITYKNADGRNLYGVPYELPGTDNAAKEAAYAFFTEWMNNTSFWVDKSKPSDANLTKYVTGDTAIFPASIANNTSGTAIDGATLYYIDVDGSASASSADFIWQEGDADGQYTAGTDTVMTTVTADSFTWLAAPTANELDILLHTNGGTVTKVQISRVSPGNTTATKESQAPLMTIAGEKMRVWLAYTPELEVERNLAARDNAREINDAAAQLNTTFKVPAGVETIEIMPYDNVICDALKNYATASTTTGELQLHDSARPRITKAIMGYDNYSVAFQFSKRIYGNSSGILNNFVGVMSPALRDFEMITEANVAVTVLYDNGATAALSNLAANESEDLRSFHYDKGSNFLYIDLGVRPELDVVKGNTALEPKETVTIAAVANVNGETQYKIYPKPVAIRVDFTSIYDFYGNALVDTSIEVPVNPAYAPGNLTKVGYAYLPSQAPAPFTSYMDYIELEPAYSDPAASTGVSWTLESTSDWKYTDYNQKDSSGAFAIGRVGYYVDTYTGTKNSVTYKKYQARLYKFPYTQLELSDMQKKTYTVAPSSTSAGKKMKNVLTVQDVYNNWRNCYEQDGKNLNANYGVWYRDLDGDGRVDAVDLNFVNPFNRFAVSGTWANSAVLNVKGSINNFRVYAQVKDAIDVDSEDLGYILPENETNWTTFDDGAHFPMNEYKYLNKYLNFQDYLNADQFSRNWSRINIQDYELIPDAAQRYTTLRLHINQNEMPLRTSGDRFIFVTYGAPKYLSNRADSTGDNGSNTYDSRYYGGVAPIKGNATATPAYNAGGNTGINLTADAAPGKWSNSDEEAGVYWLYSYTNGTTDTTHDYVNTYFIVDSFPPVMAWDGASAVPVAATAWRSTPYPRTSESNMNGYEYLDIAFSESVAYVSDHVMSDVGSGVTNKNNLVYGPWGAQVLDNNVVRFTYNKNNRTSRNFTFNNGKVFDLSGGFLDHNRISYSSRGGRLRTYNNTGYVKKERNRTFSGTAVGVTPIDSRYKVIGSENTIEMLTVAASGAAITNSGSTSSTTTSLSVTNVLLKAFSQGGGFASTVANWYRGTSSIGAMKNQVNDAPNGTDDWTYGVKITGNTQPGAGFYGAVGSVQVKNDTMTAYSMAGQYHNPTPSTTFYAPDPFGRKTGYSTANTPVKAVLSGPVYSMVKVSPLVQPTLTSRITAGKSVDVLGLNIAGSSNFKLTTVKIRVVDTSLGQFDPAIDIKPLTDDSESGVLLLDADGNAVQVSATGNEWSEWRISEEGLPYREYVLRTLSGATLATTGGNANNANFKIRITTSEEFSLGDSFYVQIPDDGIGFNNTYTVDEKKPTAAKPFWGTPNGQQGFPFTDHVYRERNNDNRWAEGEAISSGEDPAYLSPLYDGGYPFLISQQKAPMLAANGLGVKNLYYAKKNWATNPATNPFFGPLATTNESFNGLANIPGSSVDLEYNTSYAPGDDVWYDIGGKPGVYDEGIDIPLFGNADRFVLPYSVMESGAKSAQFRAAAPSSAADVSTGTISAPTSTPSAVIGLDMQDSGRGFGPRYILEGSILVEAISKNIPGGTYTLNYVGGATPTLSWEGGEAVDVPEGGKRALLTSSDKSTFVVVRRLTKVEETAAVAVETPADDTAIPFTVSQDDDRDIQQPSEIEGVRILAVGRGNTANTSYTLAYSASGDKATLAWAGGSAVDVSKGGIFTLNPAGDSKDESYLVVQVSKAGLAATGSKSEELMVYESKSLAITPLLNITGLEIMTVSDMADKGFYTVSYDGMGNVSWGSGAPASVNVANGEFVIVYGEGETRYIDGVKYDHPLNYMVLRRTGAALPSSACTDSLYVNQTRLFKVNVSITNVSGVTSDHFAPMSNDETSGISLWWDANADGTYNDGDMYVKLLQAPNLIGTGNTYTTTLYPDPEWLTAWLSRPQDSSLSNRGHNFFVCVNTTEDMSFGDSFKVSASFFELYDNSEQDTNPSGIFPEKVSFAQATTANIQCTSITNTIFTKLTTKGQTIDANTTVGLASIKHFFGTAISGIEVYMSKIVLSVVAPEGSTFDPDKAFTAMDDDAPALRGILLFKDANDNGKFDAKTDTLVPCTIKVDHEEGSLVWTYTLSPTTLPGDCKVPEVDDGLAEHFIAINLANELPYGVSFYARMEADAVTYNTGVGSAASAMITDTLSSTINSKYADLLDSSMVTATSGLVVNTIGSGVASAYHNITFGYDVASDKYTLTWNGNTVTIDMKKTGTYTLGSGDNSIEVTFDPAIFHREDTLVCSDETGRPSANIKLGVKLTSLAGQGLTYYDANANGKYDDGETIAFDGALVYGDEANVGKAVSPFTAASGLSFWDEDEDGAYTAGESIFRDTDLAYTLPWMALLVDSDNYVTAGYGGAAAGISTSTALVNASTVSVAEGETLAAKALYLYYVDRNEDGLGYVYGEDIIVARSYTAGGANAALAFDEATDHVVFDPAYDKMDDTAEYVSPLAGGESLRQFDAMDYLTFRAGGNDTAAYEQGDSLFLSTESTYVAPAFTWTIRVNKDRKIRWYSTSEPAPYNEAAYSLTAIAGLDIANSGATDVNLTGLVVRFINVSNFTIDDLRDLTTDLNSGVQLWRDMDGNGIFNPTIDKLITGKISLQNNGTEYLVVFSPSENNEVSNAEVDGIYDFFVVVQPNSSANNMLQVDDGDKFRILINNTDVTLTKTLNKTASLASGDITIDSRAPQFASEPIIADTDQDGCIETLQMVFDEKLRPGMLDDTSIWYVTDANTGNVLTVTSAILSDDYLTVTLTFSGADTAVGTGPVAIVVQYNAETALLDWAGNAVEFRKDASIAESTTQYSNYLNSSDTVTPLVLHTGMAALTKNAYNESTVAETELYFHDRNGDGVWTAGEDVWSGNSVYDAEGQRVWNGGDAWTTVVGYTGVAFTAYYCDANKDGAWNVGEFLWIDSNADAAYTAGTDTAIPIARTEEIEVLDTDANGKIDAILVRFSESLNDATMAGYDKTQDAFTPTRWSLTGYADFKACRQGVDTGAYADGQNDAKMYFIFTEGDDYDTDAVPALAVTAGETLADPAGNKLNGGVAYNSGTLVLADHSKPILVSAASDTRVLDGKLAADTTITLTFSEPLVQFLEGSPLADFTITKDGATAVALADVLEEARGMYDIDGNVITLTFVDETDGWASENITLSIAAAADTVLGDAVGNNIQSVVDYAIEGLEAADPLTFVNPAEGQYIRTDDDRLAVQIHFGEIDTTAITAWTVGIYAEDTLKSKLLSGDNSTLSKIAEDDTTNDLYGWLTAGVYEYKMVLTLTTEDGDTTYECNFFASAEGDVFDAGTVVNDGQVGDTDEILIGSATLYANWTDFAAANDLPAAASYTLSFALDGTELGSVDVEAATGEVVGSLTGFTWPADAGTVVATVTAFDADGNTVAFATSNGATLVDTLTDKNAPEIAFVNNTKSDFTTVIRKTAVNSNLYAAFEATDDTGIASYKYRLVRGAASIAWSEDEGKLNVGRRGFGYAQKDGKLYLFGGFNGTSCLASMDVYDASTRLWTAASGLNDARQLFGFASNDAICVVAGGATDSGVLDSIEVFDFASQSWSKQAVNLSVARYDCQIVAIDDNRFWVIGGTDAEGYYLDSIEQIDFTNTSAPVVTDVAVTLSQARSNFKATLQERTDGSQYVVVIGGENDFGAVGTIDLINIETLATASKSLATERCNFAAVNVPNANGGEDVWVIGGQNSSYQPLASVEVLKADGTLGALANMNMARRSLAALWIENSESVLVVGGFSTGSSESATFEMAPKTGASWTAAANTAVATGHALHALALVGTENMMADGTARIVAFGGTTAGNYSRVTESRILFDVLKDWTEVTLDEPAATATGNITVDDVELVLDETYVFEVKVTDVAGNESIIVASAGVKASTDEIEITATIACDKEIVDGIVTARNLVFTIAGDGVSQYKYSLDGGANWSEFFSVDETIAKYGLADGTYTLLVCGKDNNGNYQDETMATSLTFTVQGEGIAMTFEPALTTNGTPNASTAFTVTFTEADDVDLYKYELFKNGEIFDYNNTGIALATALELGSVDEPLEPASYTLKVYGHHGIDGTWDSTAIEQSFEIAVPALTFSPELAIDSTDTYDVSVELNGLGGGFEYQLDGGEVVSVTDTTVNLFTVGPLETGAHTLLFWALDSVGVKSAVIENAISVTSTQPIGAALKATLTSEQTYVELPADLTFTLSFDGALMNEPEAAHFTIENGEISEIAAGESNSYTVTVTPADLAAGVNQQYVSLSFNANSVYHAESGNGNKASETVKVLVYSDTVISFELAAFNYDGTDIGEAITDDTVLNPNDLLAVKLTAKGNATALFQGGELKLTYDTTKFEFVGPTKMVPTGNMVDILDPETNEVIGQEEEQEEKISETAIDPYFELVPEISIEDGVITMKAAIKNPTNAEQLFATLYFKAIAAGEAADTDFAASIGAAGILVKGVGALTADDPIVAVGTVGVNVAEVETDKAVVSFEIAETNLDEGATTNLTLNLSEAIDEDVTVTINGTDYTITAGETTATFDDAIAAQAADNKLTGDRTEEFAITAATPDAKVTYDAETTITVTTTDADFNLVDDISFDGEEAATELEKEEGEVATVVLGKFKGLLETAYDITYDYTIDDGGVDYSLADDFKGFVIAAGAIGDGATVTITTNRDYEITEDKQLTITFKGYSFNGTPYDFDTPVVLTLTVKNIDALVSDFSGDGVVDDSDLQLFLLDYGNAVEDAANPDCDLDGNGVIDFSDLMLFLLDYNGGTRGGYAEQTRSGETVTLSLRERSGKTIAKVGDVLTIDVYASTNVSAGIGSIDATFMFDVSTLAFNGEFNAESLVNTTDFDFSLAGVSPKGNLDETAGTLQLSASDNKNVGGSPLSADDNRSEVLFASFSFKVTSVGEAAIGMASANCTAYPKFSNFASGNYQPLTVELPEDLVITVGEGAAEGEFTAGLWTNYAATRGDGPELQFGMKSSASVAYNMAEGDTLANDFAYIAKFVEEGRTEALKWDIRGITEDTETYNLSIVLPAGEKDLTLDWSKNGTVAGFTMPDTYTYTMVVGNEEIDMKAVTSYTFEADAEYNVSIIVAKIPQLSQTYELLPGWNLIGVPFVLDADSTAALAAYQPMGYNADTQQYVEVVTTFEAGKAYWVFAYDKAELVVTGTPAAAANTALKAGWNLVTPLYGAANLANPADGTTIPTVWYWEETGYKYLDADEDATIGTGYWLNTTTDQVIW